jgi:predicted GIY-YIG superfamily endonuclease
MSDRIDIVKFIKNDTLKLSNDYENIIIQKLKENFTSEEEKLFLGSFECYRNYDDINDHVVELSKIWKWLGYSRIEHCKVVLLKHFKENIDYKIEKIKKEENYFPEVSGEKIETMEDHEKNEKNKKNETRGRQAENILLSINCFKKLCLKSGTKKADEIHDYYVKLEKTIQQVMLEETNKMIMLKDKEITNYEISLIRNFINKQVFYLIQVAVGIIKFGFTKDIGERIKKHKSEFGNDIQIKAIFETIYNREFENTIKKDSVINKYIIEKTFKTNQTELIQLGDEFTYEDLIKRIDYLKSINVSDLLQRISELEAELANYKIKDQTKKINELTSPIPIIRPPVANQMKIQVYDKDTLRLVRTFITIQEACIESGLYKDAVPQSIHRAIKQCTVYKGYRFFGTYEVTHYSRNHRIIKRTDTSTSCSDKRSTYL